MKKTILILILTSLIVLLMTACSWKWIKWYPQDNIVEEIIEDIIEEKTDWNIDLTPLSPEYGRLRKISSFEKN